MSKICDKHIENPAKIYGQCIGCELEMYQRRIKELELEVKTLKGTETTESPNEVAAEQ